MKTGVKIAIGVGAVLVASGIGYVIYKKVSTKAALPTPSGTGTPPVGGGTGTPPPSGSDKGTKVAEALNKLNSVLNLVKTYTAESFPLKPMMKGNNVKLMQEALRNKFGELNVVADGFFGYYTSKALIDNGYMTAVQMNVPESDFKNILAGVKK